FKAPDGRDLKLSDLKGKAVLLNLWATWCAPCRHEMPALDKLQASLGDGGFEVVTVSIDTARNAERMRAFWEETQIKALVNYSDTSGKIFQDLKVAGRAFGMPTTVLIDAKGCELGYLAGPAEWASDDALRLMRAALMRAPS
ncbi:MAG: TlpA disulfide reductase family protein, partial [Alphaproteobacteria bacterium]